MSENQFWADAVDQLDLALDQLFVGERNFDRFAIMLIDNVVELGLHRFARDKASENDLWTSLGSPKIDPKEVERALGQDFDRKVKFAHKMQLLDESVRDSLLNLHAYRNTAYHRGARHEGILHSLGVLYLRTACDVLSAYEPRGWSWSSSDRFSHRALKYLGSGRMLQVQHKQFAEAFQRLKEVAATLPHDVIGDLAADMEGTVREVDEAIAFISENAPGDPSRDDVVIECQAWPLALSKRGKQIAADKGLQSPSLHQLLSWLKSNHSWSIPKDPIQGWRKRLEDLRRARNEHDAIKRYCDFLRQTAPFRDQLYELAAQLDAHIQHQIDVARGK